MSTKAITRLLTSLTNDERQALRLRFAGDNEVQALLQRPLTGTSLPTRCGQCGQPQRTGPFGVTCQSGHVGAAPIRLTPQDWRTFETAYKITAVRVVVHPQHPQPPEYLVLEVGNSTRGEPRSPTGWRLLLGDRQIGFQPQSKDNSPHTPPTAWADEQFAGLRYEVEGAQAVIVLADGRRLDVC
jgi:hypothetical protein